MKCHNSRTDPEEGLTPKRIHLVHALPAGDDEEGLADWRGDDRLKAGQPGDDEFVEEEDLSVALGDAPGDARVPEPAPESDKVEVANLDRDQAGFFQKRSRAGFGVASIMTQSPVNVAEKGLHSGNEEHELAAGLESLAEGADRGLVVLDVLQHVHAYDGVGGVIRAEAIIERFGGDVMHGDVREGLCLFQKLAMAIGVGFQADNGIGEARQFGRKVSDSTAHLQHRATDMRSDYLKLPAPVISCAGHLLQVFRKERVFLDFEPVDSRQRMRKRYRGREQRTAGGLLVHGNLVVNVNLRHD